MFIDKLYARYSAFPKNAREIKECAKDLDIQLLKIGRILSTRWAASSFRTVEALWNNYEALSRHFKLSKIQSTKSTKERIMYHELKIYLTSSEFLIDLALMYDALYELKELSLDLQTCNINLYQVNNKMKVIVLLFKERKTNSGEYYKIALESVLKQKFKSVKLVPIQENNPSIIQPELFYQILINSVQDRMLDSSYDELIKLFEILDINSCPENPPVTFGESSIKQVCERINIDCKAIVKAMREYIIFKKEPIQIKNFIKILNCIAISSSECERGFSQMNLVSTPCRSSFLVKTISSILFLRIVGPPFELIQPSLYVKSWLLSNRNSALCTNSKKRNREVIVDPNMDVIHKLIGN